VTTDAPKAQLGRHQLAMWINAKMLSVCDVLVSMGWRPHADPCRYSLPTKKADWRVEWNDWRVATGADVGRAYREVRTRLELSPKLAAGIELHNGRWNATGLFCFEPELELLAVAFDNLPCWEDVLWGVADVDWLFEQIMRPLAESVEIYEFLWTQCAETTDRIWI
jgi:hypothetical protein